MITYSPATWRALPVHSRRPYFVVPATARATRAISAPVATPDGILAGGGDDRAACIYNYVGHRLVVRQRHHMLRRCVVVTHHIDGGCKLTSIGLTQIHAARHHQSHETDVSRDAIDERARHVQLAAPDERCRDFDAGRQPALDRAEPFLCTRSAQGTFGCAMWRGGEHACGCCAHGLCPRRFGGREDVRHSCRLRLGDRERPVWVEVTKGRRSDEV